MPRRAIPTPTPKVCDALRYISKETPHLVDVGRSKHRGAAEQLQAEGAATVVYKRKLALTTHGKAMLRRC